MVIGLIPSLVSLVVIAAVAIAVVDRFRRSRSLPPAPPGSSRVRRRVVRWGFGLIGVILAVASALGLGQRAIFLVAPLAISGYVIGLLLGEFMMPNASSGTVRRGSLEPRTVRRYVPSGWIWAWRATFLAAATAVTAAGLMGRGGAQAPGPGGLTAARLLRRCCSEPCWSSFPFDGSWRGPDPIWSCWTPRPMRPVAGPRCNVCSPPESRSGWCRSQVFLCRRR